MRILITNDDGIEAPGLDVLHKIASELSEDVWTVAPETDQSGAAHSLSLHEPLRLRQLAERSYAVKGTPTDCVDHVRAPILHDQKPDLVLSGVNAGQNIADDVTYSGTIAGAIEGTLLGIPSVALSLAVNYENRAEIRNGRRRCKHGAPSDAQANQGIGLAEGCDAEPQFPGSRAGCGGRHRDDRAG